jgi:hypothetical protein
LYGAFPTDAYSHTPGNAGAQQPGMTGQVKEDFLSRMRELGIQVENGEITFQSSLLNPDELLKEESVFDYFDLKDRKQQIQLRKKQLAFTFCQVPLIYSASDVDKTTITLSDGKQVLFEGHSLNKEISNKIFRRNGEVAQIEVSFQRFV